MCVCVFLSLFPGENPHEKHGLLLCLLWRQVTVKVVFIIWIFRNKFNILKAKTLFNWNQMKTNCNGPCRVIYDYYTPYIHNVSRREGERVWGRAGCEWELSSSLHKFPCIYREILEIKVSYSESQDLVYLKSNETPEPRKTRFLRKSTFIFKWAVATSDWFPQSGSQTFYYTFLPYLPVFFIYWLMVDVSISSESYPTRCSFSSSMVRLCLNTHIHVNLIITTLPCDEAFMGFPGYPDVPVSPQQTLIKADVPRSERD